MYILDSTLTLLYSTLLLFDFLVMFFFLEWENWAFFLRCACTVCVCACVLLYIDRHSRYSLLSTLYLTLLYSKTLLDHI